MSYLMCDELGIKKETVGEGDQRRIKLVPDPVLNSKNQVNDFFHYFMSLFFFYLSFLSIYLIPLSHHYLHQGKGQRVKTHGKKISAESELQCAIEKLQC